jgi:hypothetical protein
MSEAVESSDATPKFAPKCIWCSAPWSDDNVKLEMEGSYCYDSDSSAGYPVVSISCHECGKLMYQKEGSEC